MIEVLIILVILADIFCSVLTYGYIFNYYQKEFPTIASKSVRQDKRHALGMSIIGIARIIVVIMLQRYEHGWNIRSES